MLQHLFKSIDGCAKYDAIFSMSKFHVRFSSTEDIVKKELDVIRKGGTWKNERVICGPQGPSIRVVGQKKEILNFCANNYLGLSNHPLVVEAGRKALRKYGAGLSSVRFICGTQDIHKELEDKIARFHGRENAILYASCFDANAGLFECLLNKEDYIISDAFNHASIIDGIRLCKANKYVYKNRDMQDLENILKSCNNARQTMIATDGVFSMDGTVTPLKEICDLAEMHESLVFVDDCHATGFFGETGRGTEEYFEVGGRVDIINSTLGKAMGGASGGYTVGSKWLIDLLRNRSRPYLFSNSLPPVIVACAIKVFEMLMSDNQLTKQLQQNTAHFRQKMTEAGFALGGNEHHPICPVMVGDAALATSFADKMLDLGIYVIGFSYPVVPKGKARIRVQVSASHTLEQINSAVDAFVKIGREFGLLHSV